MGNYSYLVHQEGCLLDMKKIDKHRVTEKLINLSDGYWAEDLTEDGLGEYMDGWKIQGYWYDGFVKFLYICADCMKCLTPATGDNYIEMEEDQGYKFIIHFFLKKGKPAIKVNAMPMTWEKFDLNREGDITSAQ